MNTLKEYKIVGNGIEKHMWCPSLEVAVNIARGLNARVEIEVSETVVMEVE